MPINPSEELLEKRRLEQEISEKERLLTELIEQVENLKIDLSLVKQEYEIKIGRLYLRLDELDLEILKLKKIGEIMSKGIPFEEAQRLVEESLKDRTEHIRAEYQKLNEEETNFKSKKVVSEDEKAELTKLYRKLARRFHPDLTNGNAEMMKKINKAYADGDLETLRDLDRAGEPSTAEPQTIETLKNRLSRLEGSLEKVGRDYGELRRSEWFVIRESMELAQKQGRSFLGELAEKILSEIADRENRLRDLKKLYE